MIRAIIVLLLLAVPATAQTTGYIRDKNQNLLGSIQQRGERTYILDKAGNPQGYSTTQGGVTKFYDVNGNQRNQITPR